MLNWSPNASAPAGSPVVAGQTLERVRWSGGHLVGLYTPNVPADDAFNLAGSDILLENIAVEGCRGFAFVLNGDRIRLISPTIANVGRTTAKGVRVRGGTGFRLMNGSITVSGDMLVIAPDGSNGVRDCAVFGVSLTNAARPDDPDQETAGDLILISTDAGPVADVRLEALNCTGGSGTGAGLRILNKAGSAGAVSGIVARDAVID